MIKGSMVSGPASAMVVSKLQSGEWPTAGEYRAYLIEKGCSPGEARDRSIAYAKEPPYDFQAEAEAELLAALRSFGLSS